MGRQRGARAGPTRARGRKGLGHVPGGDGVLSLRPALYSVQFSLCENMVILYLLKYYSKTCERYTCILLCNTKSPSSLHMGIYIEVDTMVCNAELPGDAGRHYLLCIYIRYVCIYLKPNTIDMLLDTELDLAQTHKCLPLFLVQ